MVDDASGEKKSSEKGKRKIAEKKWPDLPSTSVSLHSLAEVRRFVSTPATSALPGLGQARSIFIREHQTATMRASLYSHAPGATIRARGALRRPPGLMPSSSSALNVVGIRRRFSLPSPLTVAASGSSYRWNPGKFVRSCKNMSADITVSFYRLRK